GWIRTCCVSARRPAISFGRYTLSRSTGASSHGTADAAALPVNPYTFRRTRRAYAFAEFSAPSSNLAPSTFATLRQLCHCSIARSAANGSVFSFVLKLTTPSSPPATSAQALTPRQSRSRQAFLVRSLVGES